MHCCIAIIVDIPVVLVAGAVAYTVDVHIIVGNLVLDVERRILDDLGGLGQSGLVGHRDIELYLGAVQRRGRNIAVEGVLQREGFAAEIVDMDGALRNAAGCRRVGREIGIGTGCGSRDIVTRNDGNVEGVLTVEAGSGPEESGVYDFFLLTDETGRTVA